MQKIHYKSLGYDIDSWYRGEALATQGKLPGAAFVPEVRNAIAATKGQPIALNDKEKRES